MIKTSLKYSQSCILSLVFVLLVSCGKMEVTPDSYVGPFELKGTVRDELTGKPIPYVDVRIIESPRGSTSAWGSKMAGAQITNESGDFTISFEADENKNYYQITTQENPKYFLDNNPPWVAFTKTGKGRQDITLMPKGYLTFIIKGNKGGWLVGGGGGSMGVHYEGTDTTKTVYLVPNKTHSYTYEIRDKNLEILETNRVEIFIPLPPDTAFYLIEF